MRSCGFVLCLLSGIFWSVNAYRAAIVGSSNYDVSDVISLVRKSGENDLDIIVLPSDIWDSNDNYDEVVKVLSEAAKQAGLYLVANLNENAICQKKPEIVRSNMVFDRNGAVIAVYRKATTSKANCTVSEGPVVFETDFGVTFELLMEEDLVLRSPKLKNVIVTGAWHSEIPFFSASQFLSTWAYTNNANVVSQHGIFAGRAGLKSASGRFVVADLKNVADESASVPPAVSPASIKDFPVEDLNQYVFKPLNVETSSLDLKETVCHNNFCCEFDIKANLTGSIQESNYGLAVFDGIRHFGSSRFIGIQSCAVFACAGLYKKSCSIGSVRNNTNIMFEKLTIAANFTAQNSIQYPLIITNENLKENKFNFYKNSQQTTVEIIHSENLFAFGIFGRDFENDFEKSSESHESGLFESFAEDLQEFFDYVWIRLRILLFIVSIYVLEMM